MITKEGLEYVVSLANAGSPIQEHHGHTYTRDGLKIVRDPNDNPVTPLEFETLDGILGFSALSSGEMRSAVFVVHSHDSVSLYSAINKYRERPCHSKAKPVDRQSFRFKQWMEAEDFMIGLQSMFVQTPFRDDLINLISGIRGDFVKETTDNGYGQTITVRQGVATVGEVKIQNPVFLAPFRCFPEIDQPVSPFIFRLKESGDKRPLMALFEADGGQWQVNAANSVRQYLTNATSIPVV